MYTWPPGYGPSCDRCATVVIQSGIIRIVHRLHVVTGTDAFATRWRDACNSALQMYAEAGVEVVAL